MFASKTLRIMPVRRDVFQAIADPTRRAIIDMIAKKPVAVNTIAAQFPSSRQAVSLHLKILLECGLITVRQQGRERICEARLGHLNEVNEWIAQHKKLWTRKLDDLENYLNQIPDNKKQAHGKFIKSNKRNT